MCQSVRSDSFSAGVRDIPTLLDMKYHVST